MLSFLQKPVICVSEDQRAKDAPTIFRVFQLHSTRTLLDMVLCAV